MLFLPPVISHTPGLGWARLAAPTLVGAWLMFLVESWLEDCQAEFQAWNLLSQFPGGLKVPSSTQGLDKSSPMLGPFSPWACGFRLTMEHTQRGFIHFTSLTVRHSGD